MKPPLLRPPFLSPPFPRSEEQEPPCSRLLGARGCRADARKCSGSCPAIPAQDSRGDSRNAHYLHPPSTILDTGSINTPPAATCSPSQLPSNLNIHQCGAAKREGTLQQADRSILNVMGYFSYRRRAIPGSTPDSTGNRHCPIPSLSSSEEAGQCKASLCFTAEKRFSLCLWYLLPGARKSHMEASQVDSELHGDATREGHFPALSLLSSRSTQPQHKAGSCDHPISVPCAGK